MPDETEALCPRCVALEAEVRRLQEALEWADAMMWPYVAMTERHNDGKPTEETSHLRQILGPIRRAHKQAAPLSMRAERDSARELLGELAAAARAYRTRGLHSSMKVQRKIEEQFDAVLRRAEAGAGGGEG